MADEVADEVADGDFVVEKFDEKFESVPLGENASTLSTQTHNAQAHNAQTHNAQTHNAQTHHAQVSRPQINRAPAKGMLLRLFQSELFTAAQAVHYLFRYGNEPGIQYYLCERLRMLAPDSVQFLLPQICHLMVMGPHESAPIEHFVRDLARDSLHVSVRVLWMLEGYLNDLRMAGRDARGYLRAARLLLEMQRAVFREDMTETQRQLAKAADHLDVYYGGRPVSGRHPHTGPPIVAFGCMLAAVGCPQMVRAMRPLVLMQTRKMDSFASPNASGGASGGASGDASPRDSSPSTLSSTVSLEELSRGRAFSLKRYIYKTARTLRTHASGMANEMASASGMVSAPGRQSGTTPPQMLFPTMPLFYHGEMQFVASLVGVSERLCALDRGSRLKALHAELCLINHNLPASVCLHEWCAGWDVRACGERADGEHAHAHHRVLSILPYEATVLNSAERVPYIVFIETLMGGSEADFARVVNEGRRVENSAQRRGMARETTRVVELSASRSEEHTDGDRERVAMRVVELSASRSEEHIATASGIVDVAERMRTAAVMLAQLSRGVNTAADAAAINTIRARIIREMETLEQDRLIDVLQHRGRLEGRLERSSSGEPLDEKAAEMAEMAGLGLEESSRNTRHTPAHAHDPSAAVLQEEWEARRRRIARTSLYSHLPGWDLLSVIVKSSTDIRQEHLAYQLVCQFQRIFADCQLPIFLYPCRVLVAAHGGLIETVPNAVSIHSIKKTMLLSLPMGEISQESLSLRRHFARTFSADYPAAVDNFTRSLVGYSLLTYVLQIRDRHNGNILLDRAGHIVHIDFGFMLSNSPGYVGFESAPFKLTADYVDLLDGVGSARWEQFRDLLMRGFLAIRKHCALLELLLEPLLRDSHLPCFYAGEAALLQFRERLQLSLTESQVAVFVDRLMATSALNIFTRLYDNYQYYTNGIL